MGTATTTPDEVARPLLEVEDLRVHFAQRRRTLRDRPVPLRAVDGVRLSIDRGETLGIVGESGCGKSTLARSIVRLTKPTGGRVTFGGADLWHLRGGRLRTARHRVQMVFQDPQASLNPRMTVGAILTEAVRTRPRAKDTTRERVERLIEMVGLPPDAGGRYPHEFSGGQQQRVGIARALAPEPDLIVADEPVSALDVSIRAQILNLLAEVQEELGLSLLFISHDLSVVRHISDRIAVMYLGGIVETTSAQQLYDQPLHPYTVGLVSAIPVPDPDVETSRQRIILPGAVSSPTEPRGGCRFRSRCWLRAALDDPERCTTEQPELREARDGHWTACHFAEELPAGGNVSA